MDLDALQRELARRAVGAPTPETPESQLPLDQMNAFARSLIRKRAGQVRSMLPRTVEAMGKRFEARFAEYANSRPTKGPRRHADDAIGFAAWLNAGSHTGDLARYEAAWVEIARGRRWVMRRFRHPVEDIESQGTVLMLWLRLPFRAEPVVLRWPLRKRARAGA